MANNQHSVDFSQFQQSGHFLAFTLSQPDHHASSAWSLPNGTRVELWDTGILCFTPDGPTSQDIVLSCGVHGNETAPIELVDALVQQIVQQKIQLTVRLLVLIANPPAILAGKRELVDNLNRLFSGHHENYPTQSAECRRAAMLELAVSRFYQSGADLGGLRQRALYDLHTAIRGSRYEKFAVYPFLHGAPWHGGQLNFLKDCGVNTVLLMQSPASTFSYYAAQSHGAHAFTIELGKVMPFGQNDMRRFAQCAATIEQLVTGQYQFSEQFVEADFNCYTVNRSVVKQHADFKLCFSRDIENFTSFAVGTVLAVDGDNEVRIETEGEAIIFPNADVAIGQRAMLLVKPVAIANQVR